MRLKILEKDVQYIVLRWMNTLPNVRVWRRNVGAVVGTYKGRSRFMRFGEAGMADIEGIGPDGVHIEVEIKAPGGKLSEAQLAWLVRCRQDGAFAFTSDSVDAAVVALRNYYLDRGLVWDKRWEI